MAKRVSNKKAKRMMFDIFKGLGYSGRVISEMPETQRNLARSFLGHICGYYYPECEQVPVIISLTANHLKGK